MTIIDFSYLYYKYLHTYRAGRLKPLTSNDQDITLIYYPLREIEMIREKTDGQLHICFDSPSERKQLDTDYKSNRSKLSAEHYENIKRIQDILTEIGYNIYKEDGYEADDLVYSLCQSTPNEPKVIYTADNDLLVNIDSHTQIQMFRAGKGYTTVTEQNYTEVTKGIPYNAILLYKCIVGDRSDNITGVKGVGQKKLEQRLQKMDIDYTRLSNKEYLTDILTKVCLSAEHEQALQALELVMPKPFKDLKVGTHIPTKEHRAEVYDRLRMHSLSK